MYGVEISLIHNVMYTSLLLVHNNQECCHSLLKLDNYYIMYYSTACDPAELGGNPTSTNSSGKVTTSLKTGVIMYNGVKVGSTAYLKCDVGYKLEANSTNRTCLSNGKWSGRLQNCISSKLMTVCK